MLEAYDKQYGLNLANPSGNLTSLPKVLFQWSLERAVDHGRLDILARMLQHLPAFVPPKLYDSLLHRAQSSGHGGIVHHLRLEAWKFSSDVDMGDSPIDQYADTEELQSCARREYLNNLDLYEP